MIAGDRVRQSRSVLPALDQADQLLANPERRVIPGSDYLEVLARSEDEHRQVCRPAGAVAGPLLPVRGRLGDGDLAPGLDLRQELLMGG